MHLAFLLWSVLATWKPPSNPAVRMEAEERDGWKLTSSQAGEFSLFSVQEYKARPGDTFEVVVRVRVDIHTKALPELACFDASGREIPIPSSLSSMSDAITTNWQTYRRAFPVRPGTASVGVRLRASGRGEVRVAGLEFRPLKIDTYQTGALYVQIHPRLRRGLVLESNLGIVNTGLVSSQDRDGDGKWALINVNLDKLSEPEQAGEDWRTKFEYRPNEIYWSDGAVLKSDSVSQDRPPDAAQALHFRMKVHPGPYRAILNDPGRAVAVSLDGKSWKRYEGSSEAELGALAAKDGFIDLWVDACYRDPLTAGPVYFDYVRLYPAEDTASVERLFAAARRKPAAAVRGTADRRTVRIQAGAPPFAAGENWPVRCGLPVPQGELASAEAAGVFDARGRQVPSQNRAMATWPDGSVKWLFLDFRHDFSKGAPADYTAAYGNQVRALTAQQQVRIAQTAAGLEVDTGAIRFRVSKSRFGPIEDVRLPSGGVLQRDPVSAEIRETSGKIWRALDLAVDKLQVEQAGPMHAVILVETRLAPSGKPAQGFVHRARIHAYAGLPLVQVDYFVANTDSRPRVLANSIALKIRPAGKGAGSGAIVQATADQTGQGWVSLGGEAHLSAGVAGFREQYPKALRWTPEELSIDLWASEGGEYEWIQGVGKTHRISLYYGAATGDAALLAAGPVLALATPEWYTASGAFGPIAPVSKSPLPAVEKTLAAHMRDSVVGRVGLGFENWGDHSSSGYVKGTYLWDNNEYDLPAGAIIHFVRTGEADALRLGIASAEHYADVDTIHYSAGHADWAGAAHTHSHGTVGHHTADNPNMHHAGYTQGMILASYFTGDPGCLEGAKGIADWALKSLKPESNVGQMERAMGHPLMTLTDVYEATWDDRYLRGAARLVDWATKWEHPVRSGFLAPITEQPAFYSGAPFCGGLLPTGLLKFNSWARLPEIDQMLERVARWTLTDMWRPGAGIMSKGGSPRRKADPQDIASHLRLMRHEFLRTEEPLFLILPRESMVAGFGAATPDMGTRNTGLVFNYLPWFLPLLADRGDPQPEPEFEVRLKEGELRLAPGGQAAVCVSVRNLGATPAANLRMSFQPRLDFTVTQSPSTPEQLQAGQGTEMCYQVRAPERINLTCDYNRISYAHWTASYRREGKLRTAHAWMKIALHSAP